jgi:hypothetical protein
MRIEAMRCGRGLGRWPAGEGKEFGIKWLGRVEKYFDEA